MQNMPPRWDWGSVNTFLGESYWLKLWQELLLSCFHAIWRKIPLLSRWMQEAPFGKSSPCFKCFHKATLILLLQKGYNLFVSLHCCLTHSKCDPVQTIRSGCLVLQQDRLAAPAAILIAGYSFLCASLAAERCLRRSASIHPDLLNCYWMKDKPFSSLTFPSLLHPQDT